ncbi:lipopolysaccharide biosynthesis protein [Floricoccus tropicus]|uniref:lipopolysaccharide biosynthesis protein n=1 Tax=Floricoccus tropicus TaxID=1859473 RepID=UPI001E647475|nr:oligosaccharide flippase family protein [Floricoccus tropicus]
MNTYKKLVGNSLIFAIGNLGSKFITFIMLPLYTYKLSTSEYGTTDVIQTTVMLLLPIVSLSIYDAVLRFAMDEKEEKSDIFSSGILVSIIGVFISLIVTLVMFSLNIPFSIFFFMLLTVQSFQNLTSQFCKAIGKVKLFAVNGIVLSFATALTNVLFLIVFEFGVFGYLWSIVASNLLSIIFMVVVGRLYKYVDFRKINRDTIFRMLKFSVPLVPNSIAWWTSNTISRYFILYFLGASVNGLFAVANKIPTLLSVVNSIFFQAWQMTAIEEFESEDKDEIYSNTFNVYCQVLFLGSAVILAMIQPLMSVLVSPKFYLAWEYVPFLLTTVIYSSLSGFLGQNYVAAKKTVGVLVTTIFGAVVNILGNFILVPTMGAIGAGISSTIAFFVIWLVRMKDNKKFSNMKIDNKMFILNNILIFSQIMSMYLLKGKAMYISIIIHLLLICVVNRHLLSILTRYLKIRKVRM